MAIIKQTVVTGRMGSEVEVIHYTDNGIYLDASQSGASLDPEHAERIGIALLEAAGSDRLKPPPAPPFPKVGEFYVTAAGSIVRVVETDERGDVFQTDSDDGRANGWWVWPVTGMRGPVKVNIVSTWIEAD
jgi:hypothetical protein